MQYIDPFELLQLSPHDLQSEHAQALLRKARQRILSQFELNEGMPIQFQGWEIDRSKVIELLDQLADPAHLAMHIQIADDAQILDCLQRPNIQSFVILFGAFPDASLPLILSAMLANAYAEALQQLIKGENWVYAGRLLENSAWFRQEEATAINPATRQVNLVIASFEAYLEHGNMPVTDPLLQTGMDLTFIFMLNRLPHQSQALRNRLGQCLDEFARQVAPLEEGYPHAERALEAASMIGLDLAVSQSLQFAAQEVQKYKPKKWYQYKAFAIVLGLLIAAVMFFAFYLIDYAGKKDRRQIEVELYQLIEQGGTLIKSP